MASFRNRPPGPDPEAEGNPHTVVEKPGKDGQYTSYNEDGTYKQYRGSGKDHGPIKKPNVKETQVNPLPDGTCRTGNPTVRYPTAEEIPN